MGEAVRALLASADTASSSPSTSAAAADDWGDMEGGVYWRREDQEEWDRQDWDWIAVLNMKRQARRRRRREKLYFLLQWHNDDGGGTEWVREDNCALARVWDWLYTKVLHNPGTVDEKWKKWEGVIEREWNATHTERARV